MVKYRSGAAAITRNDTGGIERAPWRPLSGLRRSCQVLGATGAGGCHWLVVKTRSPTVMANALSAGFHPFIQRVAPDPDRAIDSPVGDLDRDPPRLRHPGGANRTGPARVVAQRSDFASEISSQVVERLRATASAVVSPPLREQGSEFAIRRARSFAEGGPELQRRAPALCERSARHANVAGAMVDLSWQIHYEGTFRLRRSAGHG